MTEDELRLIETATEVRDALAELDQVARFIASSAHAALDRRDDVSDALRELGEIRAGVRELLARSASSRGG